MTLPSSGDTTFAQLQRVLAAGESFLGSPTCLRLRAILVRGPGPAWHNYQVEGLLVPSQPDREERVLEMGDTRLVEWWTDHAALSEPDGLRLGLARWRDVVGAPSGFQFQDTVRLYRDFPGAAQVAAPTWRVELHENVPQQVRFGSLPCGPLYHEECRLFAEDVKDLTSHWFERGERYDRPSGENQYAIRIPDRRARFTGIHLDEQAITISCTRLPSGPADLRCAWQWTGFRGDAQNGVEDVVFSDSSTECEVEIVVGGLQTLKLWLVDLEGYCYDQFYELPWRPGRLTIGGLRRGGSAELRGLRDAGESDTVEFKLWVSAVRGDGKRGELVRSACAFVNTQGGTIYIGVDQHGDVVGTGRSIRKDYRNASPDIETLRDRYTSGLRRILTEAIAPTLVPEFEWLDVAGLHVLAIRVPRGPDRPYELVEDGTSYVRRGATNRRAGPREFGGPHTTV